jgi:hypothetical protein
MEKYGNVGNEYLLYNVLNCNVIINVFGDFGGMCGEREFMQRLSAALHGTLGSYLRDALQEGSVDVVACLPAPRAQVFPSFLLFAWWSPRLFLIRILFLIVL